MSLFYCFIWFFLAKKTYVVFHFQNKIGRTWSSLLHCRHQTKQMMPFLCSAWQRINRAMRHIKPMIVLFVSLPTRYYVNGILWQHKIDRIFRNFKESIKKIQTNVIQIDKNFHVRTQSAFVVLLLILFFIRKGSYIKYSVPIRIVLKLDQIPFMNWYEKKVWQRKRISRGVTDMRENWIACTNENAANVEQFKCHLVVF